jgi:hypothetical protein
MRSGERVIFCVLAVIFLCIPRELTSQERFVGDTDFESGVVATVLSVDGGVYFSGNVGNYQTRRFARASEKLYLHDGMRFDEGGSLVLRLKEGWLVSFQGPGFLSFSGRNLDTGGLILSVRVSRFLADPPLTGLREGEELWLHTITPYGTLQNKHAKLFFREGKILRTGGTGESHLEVVVLPRLEENIRPLVLVQTAYGDTWIAGPENRVVLTRGSPPPEQEEVRMLDYEGELKLMNSLFKAKAAQSG